MGIMNNKIKVSSLISIILIVIGAVFKLNHWPYAALALLFGMAVFNFFFLPFYTAYLLNAAFDKKIKIVISAFSILAGVLSIATIFQIQHWPGNGVVSISSVLLTLVILLVTIPILIIKVFKSEISNNQKFSISFVYLGSALFFLGIVSRMVLTFYSNEILVVGFLFLLFGIYRNRANENKAVVTFFKNKVELSYLFTQILNLVFLIFVLKAPSSNKGEFNQINKRILTNVNNIGFYTKDKISFYKSADEIKKVNNLTDEALKYIDDLKVMLAKKVHQDNTPAMALSDMYNLKGTENYDIPTGFLIGGDPGNPRKGHFSANELKNKLIAYKIHLLSMTDENDKAAIEKRINLDFSDKKEDEFISSWEVYNFYHATLSHDLITLSQIQLEVKITETIMVDYLIGKNNS
jgi:hypothetical protein